MSIQTIDPAAFANIVPDSIIIDVRTRMEHDACRLCRLHQHIPLDQLEPQQFLQQHGYGLVRPLYLLCRGGTRARQAAEKFVAAGCQNVFVVTGGLDACQGLGQPVEGHAVSPGNASLRAPITLERQVRIAAGSIVVLGSMLALMWSVGFAIIPLLVGGGLIFAGITDRCGLALVLTKAPWNQPCAVASTRCCLPSHSPTQE